MITTRKFTRKFTSTLTRMFRAGSARAAAVVAGLAAATALVMAVGAVAVGASGAGAAGMPGGPRPAGPGASGSGRLLGGGPAVGCTGPPGAGARCWPVAGQGPRGRPKVLRLFDPPAAPWAAGHRGVDLRAGPAAAVRSAAPGVIAFTGSVAGTPIVVVRLAGGLRTTYEPVRATLPVGARVAAGTTVGTLAGADALPHCPGACLHWGLLLGPVYLDPLTLLPQALLRPGPSRLLPLSGRWFRGG